MSSSMLKRLISAGEGKYLALEENERVDSVAQSTVSFLNGDGGNIVVGIDEKGNIIGVENATDMCKRMQQTLAEKISPASSYSVNVVSEDGKNCIVIDVPPGPRPPYIYDGRIFVRKGVYNMHATGDDISSMISKRSIEASRWERGVALGATIDDVDSEEVKRAGREIADRRLYEFDDINDAEIILKDLNLMMDGRLLNSAVALFGKKPGRLYPQIKARAVRYSLEKNEIYDDRVLSGNLFQIQRQLEDFVRGVVPITSSLPSNATQRIEQPGYPWIALREALMNAIVHRDYSLFDGNVVVSVYHDKIRFWNPGELANGLSVDDIGNGGVSRPHNPDMAYVFLLRGYIEQLGTGGRRIVEECERAGLPKPRWEIQGGGISLTFALRKDPAVSASGNLLPRMIVLLNELKPGDTINIREYHARFASDVSDRRSRTDLAQMVRLGYLQKEGAGPATRYIRTDQNMR